MKLTIEKDNGEKEVFVFITDVYISYLQEATMAGKTDNFATRVTISRSHSWGGNLRELVKEVQQSLVELQEILREKRDGGTR